MLQRPELVAAREELHAAVVLGRRVDVHESIEVGATFVGVERVVLVHGEGGPVLGGLGVQGDVVQLHLRPDQIGDCLDQPFLEHGARPRGRVVGQLMDGDQLRL